MEQKKNAKKNTVTNREAALLYCLSQSPYRTQRALAAQTNYSLGLVNRTLHSLADKGYIDSAFRITAAARKHFAARAPRNAIILAAGFGMRMVPISLETPKAFLEVHGEPLIERIIGHLHEAGVTDITVVVGFMKEAFDYLIDKYQVQLVVNPDYAVKNNLSSLALVADRISNTYIIPSDVWCRNNPFRKNELHSWYMVSNTVDNDSLIRVNRKMELVATPRQTDGNAMIGISYLLKEDAAEIREKLRSLNRDSSSEGSYWERALFDRGRMTIPARLVSSSDVVEIDTYEQLRELDSDSNHLRSDALDVIAKAFSVTPDQIVDIDVLKKGMTNRSFLFNVKNEKYIMRIPGEGTDQLIDRADEAAVFRAISGKGLCDDPVYIDPDSGYKITRYLDGIRTADPYDPDDLKKCMKKLREFHDMGLRVDHSFDIFRQIDYYESLWNGHTSIYKDHAETREHVLSLRPYVESLPLRHTLTHIDAVPDNFLFYNRDGREELQLTDWEYAGMCDPHLDLAMWSVYSFYDRAQIDHLIDIYFDNACEPSVRTKIYCYVAAAGLLWADWCEYKSTLGVEFGEYAMKQCRYAKDFYRLAAENIQKQS